MDMETLEKCGRDFLAVIERHYNLSNLQFDDGACTLAFDGGNSLTLYPQFEGIRSILMHAVAGVAPLNGEKSRALFLEMLNGNDAWALTAGATLGMDRKTGIVSLWQRFVLPADDAEEIVDAAEALLASAEYWRRIIVEHGGQPLFRTENAPESPAFSSMLKA